MSAWTCRHTDGKVVQKIVPPRLRIPYWKGPWCRFRREARARERRRHCGGGGSLKVLDPKWPIREADSSRTSGHVRKVPRPDSCSAATHAAFGDAVSRAQPALTLWLEQKLLRSR